MPRSTDSEDKKVFFRMDRFFQQNGEWYYTTRDGEQRGPFEDKDDAEGDLILFIRECNSGIG